MAAKKKFYVYVIRDDVTPVYVGKGSGRRMLVSARRHGGAAEILERCDSEDEAFDRERHWIAELKPTNNVCRGGNGGRAKPRDKWALPAALKGKISGAQWRSSLRAMEREMQEIEAIGARKYAARFLLSKLDEGNCEGWGVSKVDLSRLREVAHG